MRKLIILTFALYGFTLLGQGKEMKKSESVIIYNNEIISKKTLQEYSNKGLIKTMNIGVTQEERDKLAEKFGKEIDEKNDLIKIELYKERNEESQSKTNSKVNKNRTIELKRS